MVEDCRDVAQEVPFIGTEEKCEELVFDECVEVSMFKLVLSFQSSKEHYLGVLQVYSSIHEA